MSENNDAAINYDKPFKDYPQQVQEIRAKNIVIEESEFTFECLESISYYSLINGYKDLFLVGLDANGKDIFQDGITFENIYSLYTIDTNLNNILFKYILKVEKSLKTKLAYLVSSKYGVDKSDYLDHRHYSNSKKIRSSVLTKLKKDLKECKEGTAIHYYEQNKNHTPPWILVNHIYFFEAINWYSTLIGADKEYIVSRMLRKISTKENELDKEFLINSLKLIRSYRNNIAHGNRTFKSNVKEELPKKPLLTMVPDNVLSATEFKKGLGKNDLYAVFLIIIILTNDSYAVQNFLNDLRFTLLAYAEVEFCPGLSLFQTLGLPDDLFSRLESLTSYKFSS